MSSNGTDYDMYLYGYQDLDERGGGFISRMTDADKDGIMDVVDTDDARRGAPQSPAFAESV